ncbi:plasmid replication protein RepC [Rhizobium laguerreae]|uniref:plasmid replication protein RepC n=1 Tax=Rhizobium laguerreae TaxID=1076926 RepID=UPI001C905D64|nr:plasmid replication protein RepC [Rhizobium laguerreae]MBY3170519.1 replication initiation protein RepC [Rhizobium laguerreae]MBY3231564.1 replication initiation protein RepC [Rhizobium laguerreae]MBY3346553.1 replication initiation protein RepC [Rhizobium laguerreae]MBY3353515.1 replication initiation protein RepC [Rhizobium laguerreae]MBY3374560.1 replication initiation protein RepC [Rhizobium laguerreae]
METGSVTTPFGRRSMTLGMLANQVMAGEIKPDQSVDKWKLFRALCEAKPLLGIGDRALAVLNALLSFYPKNELAEENGLIVFPSNIQLSLRTHGMAEQTVRRHLAALVEAGLLLRKDSPNGKRYVRRDRAGEVNEAFGFSLAPLLARAEEIERLAAEVMAERLHVQRLRERITLCRRDIAKLIEAAVEEEIPGDWEGLYGEFRDLIEGLPRTPTAAQLELLLHELEALRTDILNRLEIRVKSAKQRGNANYIERHIQNSNPESTSEVEPGFETKQGAMAEQDKGREVEMLEEGRGEAAQSRQEESRQSGGRNDGGGLKSFPLSLVLHACPEILAYGPDGVIRNWRDLMAAAVIVRSMLGVSPSAYEEAANVMGPENAATVMACILERGGHINSAGGYLRGLTRRSEKGEFAIGPMLMALLRANAPAGRKAG